MPVTRNQSHSAAASAAAAAAVDTSGPKDSSDSSEASTEPRPPRPDSPENCSICLGPFSNKSFTSSCAHSFCFICLKQWSKVKAECPLCKQSFTSIFHSIRSNDSYDIYELPPMNPSQQMDYDFYNFIGGSLNALSTPRHYVNLAQPHLDAALTLSNFSRFQFRNHRFDRFLNYVHPAPSEHQYSYSNATFSPSSHASAASWPTGAEAFRLHVYRYHLGPPAVILGCENSTYRLTPAMVNASAHRMQRLMPWLTRELRVLLKSHQSVRLAISIIQPLLSQVTVDSQYFSGRVSPLIGQRAQQFIQEFIAFTNSALTMQAFDRKAMYRRHLNRFYIDNTSSSSSDDDDVVEVTEVSPDVHISNVTTSSSNTAASLQRARWDSPTPGPSWEIMDTHISIPPVENDRVSVSSESDPVFQPQLNDSDADSSESDIVFVKFDKPWNQRSPVRVSSDSEGDGQSRKHKKLKDKKRKREALDTSIETAEKDKKHKSSKSRSKERVRPSVSDSGEEFQQRAEVNVSVSISSSKHKRKRHRKSREKSEDAKRHKKSDREIVDRLFAKALTQQHNVSSLIDSADVNIPSSSKSKERDNSKSSGKDKHRRKRKKRSRSSASPSVLSSYKKHHSGHKKTSDRNESERRSNHGSEKRKHKRRRKSKENAVSDYSSRRTASLEKESQIPRNQPSASHSMTGTFQASYLAGADRVQHIPLNLWVATWPSLPVSHSFATPSASASFLPSSLPASSNFSSQHLNDSSERTNSAINSQTISSESQSSDDSDTDCRPGGHTHPRVPECSRTRQWLDANFSSTRHPPPLSSSLQMTSEASNSARNCGVPKTFQPYSNAAPANSNTFGGDCDVVSIESGDEDIRVSSDSSTESDREDVTAVKNCDNLHSVVHISSHNSSYTGSGVLNQAVSRLASSRGIGEEKRAKIYSSSSKNTSSPLCTSFQPFKLHKKSALAKHHADPIFSRTAQNSDDDVSDSGDVSHSVKLHVSDQEKTSSVQDTLRNSSTAGGFKTNLAPSRRLESSSASSRNSHSQENVSSPAAISVIGRSQPNCLNREEQNVTRASTSSSSSSAVFSMLPPVSLTAAAMPTLSYLPYSSLSLSAPPPSILSGSLPSATPRSPLPHTMPLHFPRHSLLSTSSAISPPGYIGTSQDAHRAPATKVRTLKKGTSSSRQLSAGGKFTVIKNNKAGFSGKEAREDGQSSTSA